MPVESLHSNEHPERSDICPVLGGSQGARVILGLDRVLAIAQPVKASALNRVRAHNIVFSKIRPRILGLAMVALGLLALGSAIFVVTSDSVSRKVSQASDFSAIPAKTQFAAPTLALNDLNGTPQTLTDYRGRVVLVNLWATWCPPCAAEMPNLQVFFDKHRLEGFVVVAIEDGDPMSQVVSFVQTQRLTFPIWLDPSYQATDRAFRTSNLPSSYVIDREGIVRLAWVGAINAANLEKFVTPVIQE